MELDTLVGDRKTALFVIISDTDDTFNFVVSILYPQLLAFPTAPLFRKNKGELYRKSLKNMIYLTKVTERQKAI